MLQGNCALEKSSITAVKQALCADTKHFVDHLFCLEMRSVDDTCQSLHKEDFRRDKSLRTGQRWR